MSLRWRWSLVVVLAAMVLGSFIPQAFLHGALTPASMTTVAPQGPPTFPSGCAGTNCGKSAPTPATPALTIAALTAAAALAVRVAAGYRSRRIRPQSHVLPRGSLATPFHPPKFSRLDPSAA